MKYFITEEERKLTGSTNFYEFQKGDWDEDKMEFWSEDSISIDDNIMWRSAFDEVIIQAALHYDPFGGTRITKPIWSEILRIARERGGEVSEVAEEADLWAQETFSEHDMFTILGL